MQVVELNLASRPFKNDTLLWVGFFAGAMLLAGATWWNVQTYTSHRELIAGVHDTNTSMRERFAEVDRRGNEALKEIESYDLDQVSLRSDAANEVIRWKSFSWTKLFNQLEQIQPWDVQMTSVHPVFRSSEGNARSIDDLERVPVSVEGVAKDIKEFFKLQRALTFDPHFDFVLPEGYNTDVHSGETVFRMRFLYDPRVDVSAEEEILAAGAAGEPAGGKAPPATAEAAEPVEQSEPVEMDAKAAALPQAGVEDPANELASDDTLKRIPRGKRQASAKSKEEGR